MNRLRGCVIAALSIVCAGALPAQNAVAPREEREAAVAQARAGNTRVAVASLRALLAKYPEDARLLADTAIVANWAGEDAYVLELYAHSETPKDDAGLTEAAARSARNLHHYDEALNLYRGAALLATDRWQPLLGQAMVLTDEQHYADAAAQMRPLLREHLDEADVESGEAYLCSRQGDYACVIDMDQRLMAHRPQDQAAIQCDMATALVHVGGATLGEDTCPQADSQDDRFRVEAKGAERVRWIEASTGTWAQKRAEGEEALKLFDRAIADSKTHDDVWMAAEFDRLLALYDLRHMREVIGEFVQLHAQKIEVPSYALASVAGAYLALHHPRHAAALYKLLVRRSPDNGEMWGGLAYAQLESEQISASLQTVDQAYQEAPPRFKTQGLAGLAFNEEYVSLGAQVSEMRGNADMPAQEYARLANLLASAPANQSLNRAMAMSDLSRGWPQRAMIQERIANSNAQPDSLPVLEDAEVLEAAGHRDQADAIVPALLARDGNSPPIDRFLTDRAIERDWQADAETGYERSSGKFIGTTEHSDGHLYSPLVENRWRGFAHALGDTGNFSRGSAYRARTAVGASYDYERESVWVEAGADTGTARTVAAAAVGADLNYGDNWTMKIEGDTDNVTEVQLIAELGKVHARSASVNLEWRQNEQRDIHAGVERLLFSDGNQRTAIRGEFDQRVWTSPRIQVTVTPELSSSTNSENENRIYFNPKADFSLGPSTTAHWLTWRRYNRSFTQDLTVSMAPYWQQNYGTGAAVSLAWQQRLKLSKRLSIFGKESWDSQPYDGSSQPYSSFVFGLKWGQQ